MTAPFPTRRDEEWRYADLDSLKPLWADLAEPETIDVGPGEQLEQVWLPGGGPVDLRRVRLILAEGATARIFALNAASDYGRIEIDIEAARGARFEMFAANIGTDQSNNEIVATMRHAEPDGSSLQVIRSVLGGKAVGSYLGRIAVARDAQKTDAEQSVKAILTSRGATANARPELEIFADDVKCAHGATVGELDERQLFYLQSRGVPPAQARTLLLEGFVMGLWDTISDDDERAKVQALASQALRRVV